MLLAIPCCPLQQNGMYEVERNGSEAAPAAPLDLRDASKRQPKQRGHIARGAQRAQQPLQRLQPPFGHRVGLQRRVCILHAGARGAVAA